MVLGVVLVVVGYFMFGIILVIGVVMMVGGVGLVFGGVV